MARLKKATRWPHQGREENEGQVGDSMEQAGRSGSHLAVERDSTSLRSQSVASATTQDSSSSRPNMQRATTSTSELERRVAVLNASLRATHSPVVPSALNPASSLSSLGSSEEQPLDDGKVSPIDLSSTSSGNGSSSKSSHVLGSRETTCTPSTTQQIVGQESTASIPKEEISRPGTPKHLKDLGRDYSRYPPSSSAVQLNLKALEERSPLPASASTTSLLRTTTRNPFSDSEADIDKWGYPDDSLGTFNPYYGGEKGFILYANEVEDDDKYHMPADDDDITYKPKLSEYLERRSIISAVGGVFLVLGLLCVFIVLPVLTYTTRIYLPSGQKNAGDDTGPAWAHVNNNTYPLLQNVRKGLIDEDTPRSAYTRASTFDNSHLNLVFSDEFNKPNRTFFPGDDPYWTAPDIWYGATQDMEWYDPDAVTTGNGTLQLRLDRFPNHGLQFRSGMLNSWNQLCFKGGVFEVSISLAGPAGVPGLWPGAWSMGNLGRPGYLATTHGVWPYTYDSCDVGITANQSSPDGLSFLPGQKLSACSCEGDDHPNPGTGRGAPEIDILEASVDPNNRIGVVTQSFQVAPFDVWYRPNSDFMQIPNYETTQMNSYCGGPYQQAISGTTLLNNNWYDDNEYQKYSFEYVPGTDKGKIAWFVGNDQSFMMDGRAIGSNGNVGARQVSEEPMSMVLNLGISGSWSEILMDQLKFPTIMHIDYVRIYQKPGEVSVTCDPPGYPTTEYIAKHPEAYRNPNKTAWDETGYLWPKNKLSGC